MSEAREVAAVILLAKRGYHIGSITHLTGLSAARVKAIVGQRGLSVAVSKPADSLRITLPAPAAKLLSAEAAARDLSPAALARRVLEQALAGGPNHSPMLKAILDD